MAKYWVNAPGAESVAFDSKEVADAVAKQVKGADVTKGTARPKGRHRYADGSAPDSGVGTPVSHVKEGPLRRLFRR